MDEETVSQTVEFHPVGKFKDHTENGHTSEFRRQYGGSTAAVRRQYCRRTAVGILMNDPENTQHAHCFETQANVLVLFTINLLTALSFLLVLKIYCVLSHVSMFAC